MAGINISSAPGVKRLSDLMIDFDKDWNEKSIHNVKNSEVSELRLIPKISSSGAEGTMFYDSEDKCIYLAVEE